MSDLSLESARERLEREIARATRTLTTTAELCKIFAQDDSEKANIAAVESPPPPFRGPRRGPFYVNGSDEYRFCLAGTEFPIGLAEARWRRA